VYVGSFSFALMDTESSSVQASAKNQEKPYGIAAHHSLALFHA